jgi:hypothetical protein
MKKRPADNGALPPQTLTKVLVGSVPVTSDGDDDRPRCGVVGGYCEALGWLRREPSCPAAVCCRSYWADAEGMAS